MKISAVLQFLEQMAPPSYQESYDNSGLLVGSPNWEITGVMVCLDALETVLDEAIDKGCNLVIAHHPIIFKGLKRITGKNYVERIVQKAIKKDIALYAIHTNLDNVYYNGVNSKIAAMLGLENTKILAPKRMMRQINSLIPAEQVPSLQQQLSNLLDKQHFGMHYTMLQNNGEEQAKVEIYYPNGYQRQVERALNSVNKGGQQLHQYFDIANSDPNTGSGMIGILPTPLEEDAFLQFLKERMKAACVRHTALLGKPIKKIAVCGGAGGFLLKHAISKGADVFVTADYKYHEFFDADGKIVIADIGHYESEQYTIDLLADILSDNFSTFAVLKTTVNTNPIHYF